MELDFDRFAADLLDGLAPPCQEEDPAVIEEVKLGCTLAMLTCLDRAHRVAYILGEVFDLPGETQLLLRIFLVMSIGSGFPGRGGNWRHSPSRTAA